MEKFKTYIAVLSVLALSFALTFNIAHSFSDYGLQENKLAKLLTATTCGCGDGDPIIDFYYVDITDYITGTADDYLTIVVGQKSFAKLICNGYQGDCSIYECYQEGYYPGHIYLSCDNRTYFCGELGQQ